MKPTTANTTSLAAPAGTIGTGVLFRAASATFLDQLAISSVHFLVGLLFIYRGTPEQYGLFSFFMAVFALLASLQNSMVNTPLMVLAPRLPPETRATFERGLWGVLSLGVPVAMILLLLSFGALRLCGRGAEFTALEVPVFALSLAPLMLRDFWRAQEYARLRPGAALRRDLSFSILTLMMLALLLALQAVRVGPVLAAMALAALAVVTGPSLPLWSPPPGRREIAGSFERAWALSQWSLLGATSSWFQNSAYVYLPFFLLGVREVAYLAAARLLMTPAWLLAQSWGNYFRPLASKNLATGNTSGALHTFARSNVLLLGFLGIFTAVILVALKALPEAWIPGPYRGIGTYVALWALIILITTIHTNASSLLQASLAFKSLALRSLGAALLTVGLTALLILELGLAGALVARVIGEVILMILLLAGLRKAVLAGRGAVGEAP